MNGAPFVLCGPIVRRVDPTSVTVFVAVRGTATVVLRVFPLGQGPAYAPGDTLLSGTRTTVRLGEHLHVVAVTATGGTLQPGTLYGYDLAFPGSSSAYSSLLDAGAVAADRDAAIRAIAYAKGPGGPEYPGFATPPDDPGKLRILHGSCRGPHGQGEDAFPGVDPIIAAAAGDPLRRPHQLILGGDQIYADDVADPLLAMMHDHTKAGTVVPGLATRLGMLPETMPVGSLPNDDEDYLPGSRGDDLELHAKFTSGHADSHLMSFREYACMYLMAWSDKVWPATYPLFEDVFPAETRILKDPQGRRPGETVYDLMRAGRAYSPSAQQKAIIERYVRWQEQGLRLKLFQQGLPAVRRALANVPTYMIFDDHEVTDDWNMTADWVTKASVESPLGRRIVRNGLAAYAVFQGWGNAPERYAPPIGNPGWGALTALVDWFGAPGDATKDKTLRDKLGMPEKVGDDGRPVRPAGALTYHFSVTWPKYQLIALDTRTWREYPKGADKPGGLLLSDQPLNEMITGSGVLGDDAVTVVAQPVALFGVPILEQAAQPLAKLVSGRYEADAKDAWVASDAAVHKIMSRLFAAAPPDGSGVRRRRVVMLGGDIHFGSAERIRYSATLPYACGPDPAKPYEGVNKTEGVLAGFVSSGFHNEDFLTRRLHGLGYVPLLDATGSIDLVGWANEEPKAEGKRFQAGVRVTAGADATTGWWVSGRPAVSSLDRLDMLSRQPEWQVHVDFVRHDEADPEIIRPGTATPVVDPAGLPREQALGQYLGAARNLYGYLDQWGDGKEIVGRNNLGEITFDWPAGDCKKATQTLWWRLPGENAVAPLTRLTVDMSLGCSLQIAPPYDFTLVHEDRDAAGSTKAKYDGVERRAAYVREPWVRRLQQDLIELGFRFADTPTGVFDTATYLAVREFQTYARRDEAAKEPATATALRYSDRLEQAEVAEEHRYLGPVSGVADLATQVAIKYWKEQRWRCPVVVEAWQVSGSVPQTLAAPNVWRWDHEATAGQRLFSRDITGRPPGAGPAPAGHPELVPLGVRRTNAATPQWSGPVAEPVAELLPEHLLPVAKNETTGPGLARLATQLGSADEAVREKARAQLSTFKVLRALAENTAAGSLGAFFDALVAADTDIVRFGPFGWRAHGPAPTPTAPPPQLDWKSEPGVMWAYLAYLKARDVDAYDALSFGSGLSGAPGWGKDGGGLLYAPLRVLRARPRRSTASGAGDPIESLFELVELRGWHWVHRWVVALRAHDGVRRGMWTFARQQLHDLLTTAWDPPEVPVTVPDVPDHEGKPRRVRIGDLFTSERAVAMLACWAYHRPNDLVGVAAPNAGEKAEHRGTPRAATRLRQVLTAATALGQNFSTAPTTWTGAHEDALIRAITQVVTTDPPVNTALAAVRAWPSAPAGTYQLPLTALPEAERTLSPAHGSLRFDTTDLPRWTR